jgi:hypothetical protein
MKKLIRNLLCKLGYHQIEGHPDTMNFNFPGGYYYLICKNCHYHIANIKIKD